MVRTDNLIIKVAPDFGPDLVADRFFSYGLVLKSMDLKKSPDFLKVNGLKKSPWIKKQSGLF